jgi:hypothetical protein
MEPTYLRFIANKLSPHPTGNLLTTWLALGWGQATHPAKLTTGQDNLLTKIRISLMIFFTLYSLLLRGLYYLIRFRIKLYVIA